MNTEQKQQVIDIIDSLKTFDILKTLAAHRPPAEIDALMINDISIKSLAAKYGRAIKQLESELRSDNHFYLPIGNNDPRLSGEFNLVTNLNNMRLHIENNDPHTFYGSLMNQILYQVIWGFWDRSNKKIHDVAAIQLNEAAENIETNRKNIEAQNVLLGDLFKSIEQKMGDMQSFMEQKQKDVELINSKREEILNHVSEANQIIINVNELKSQTEAAKNTVNEFKEDAKRSLDEQKDIVKNFNKQGAELILNLDSMIKNSKENLKEIKDDYEEVEAMKNYIEIKEEEIVRLAAQASDGALGHMFDKRKTDLQKSAGKWMWATIIMTVALFGWVFIVFSFLSGTTYEPDWINPLIAVIKTVPAFILLAFFAKQYTKERNLQEEYAFKASIAMTIMAYADVIDTDSENAHRIEIIKQSIDRVYRIPKITTEKMSLFGLNSKARKEAVEDLNKVTSSLTEALKSVKKV